MKLANLLIIAMLLAAPSALADATFTETNAHQSPDQKDVQLDDEEAVLAVSYRSFRISEPANITAQYNGNVPDGYNLTVAFSSNAGQDYTTVGGINDTQASQPYMVVAPGDAMMRVTIDLPVERTPGFVNLPIIVAIDSNETEDIEMAHRVVVFYYAPGDDSDADDLPDDWEEEQFNGLGQGAHDDPDGDGYDNSAEYAAGTDPNNAASIPENVFTGGGGAGGIGDRDVTNAAVALAIFSGIALLLAFFIAKPHQELDAVRIVTALGIAIVLAFLALAAMDAISLAGNNWAWWAATGTGWQAVVGFSLATTAILANATITLIKVREGQEGAVLASAGAGILVLAFLSWLLFGLAGVPVLGWNQ